MSKIIKSFPPIINKDSRVLILGTMPGPQALRQKEYYAFPGNHFWRIILELFDPYEKRTWSQVSYPSRINLILENRLALWDTIASCHRESSLDCDIRNAHHQDIASLVKRYPNIECIACNGVLSWNLLHKHERSLVETMKVLKLPSTSPANASISYERKLKMWRSLIRYSARKACWC